MQIKVEIDKSLAREELVIKYHPDNADINKIIANINNTNNEKLTCYKGDKVTYLSLDDIIFFESDNSHIVVHTINDIYNVKYKLYELEQLLPSNFIRVSKSTIININDIYTINRHITSSSLIEFRKTHKKVYVSRFYYKNLILKLKEKR